jgi:DNA-binding transcriptional regulator LsrR (DeoR family)
MTRKDGQSRRRPPSTASPRPAQRPSSSRSKTQWEDLAPEERLSVVCRLFCEGNSPAVIARRVREDYAASTFTRQAAYPMLLKAAEAGWLRFVPKASFTWSSKLRAHYNWLTDVKVVHTNQFEDVAYQGAEMLITLLQHMNREAKQKVHIGFAGGHAMRRLAQIFAQLLDESEADLPETLVLHALVAGFEVLDPTTDPNTFFMLFRNRTSVNTRFEFVGLHTPPVVRASEYEALRGSEGIRESYEYARDLDIIVTSAADWSDEHSTFRRYMEKSADCAETLVRAGCIGDMLWLPMGPRGPLEVQTKIRSMSLIELRDLPALVRRGKFVLLVLGPCAMCQRTKSQILASILGSKPRLISHLVVDTRSAREVLR